MSARCADPIAGHRVELQLLTTLKCNLKCSYRSPGVGDVPASQSEVRYSIDQLARFAGRHLAGKGVYVTFYGGDSLARREQVLRQLIERFVARADSVYPLIPLLGIVRNKRFPGRAQELYAGRTQCRMSSHLIDVMPAGQIYPCPDMMYVPAMRMGSMQGNWLGACPLQQTATMPCRDCEAYAWCRGNCMKNLYLGYVKHDLRYRHHVVNPICSLARFIGREVDRRRPQAWFVQLSPWLRRQLSDCEVYEYVEVMP